jgi:signal transduction histidine kinase
MHRSRDGRSPGAPPYPPRVILLAAALSLVPPSATAQQLDARFAAAGADLRPGTAQALLEELTSLGLVRVVRRDGEQTRHVVTTLGRQYADRSLDEAAKGRLVDLEVLRTDLLSTISHELRTPLTAIRTSAGLLLDPASRPTEGQRRQLLEAIARNGERMQRLIGDILELSRFRSGSISLQLRRFRAAALAEGTLALVAPLATPRRQRLELVDDVGPDHAVYGDHRRLEQALLNLVSNAQKFAPDESVVRVRVSERGQDTAWAVTDAGPGIPPEDQERLFERFFVGRNDRSGPREGVGLGLPTALAIAQAHDGTIEVDSVPGRGSTLTLVVPTHGPAGAMADDP